MLYEKGLGLPILLKLNVNPKQKIDCDRDPLNLKFAIVNERMIILSLA